MRTSLRANPEYTIDSTQTSTLSCVKDDKYCQTTNAATPQPQPSPPSVVHAARMPGFLVFPPRQVAPLVKTDKAKQPQQQRSRSTRCCCTPPISNTQPASPQMPLLTGPHILRVKHTVITCISSSVHVSVTRLVMCQARQSAACQLAGVACCCCLCLCCCRLWGSRNSRSCISHSSSSCWCSSWGVHSSCCVGGLGPSGLLNQILDEVSEFCLVHFLVGTCCLAEGGLDLLRCDFL